MDVCLVMFKGELARREFPVTKSRIVIGRVNSCDLRIPLSSVSRKHCELKVVRGVVKISDLGSSNGTYVNGTRISKEASLHPGDRIQVGPVVFTLIVDGVPKVDRASDSLMEAQVEAERKTGDEFSQFTTTQTREDEKTAPATRQDIPSMEPASIDDQALDMDDSAAIILPDDDEEDGDQQAVETPQADAPQTKATLPVDPDNAGSSVLEEFDNLLDGIESKIDAEHDDSPEQLGDDDLIKDPTDSGDLDEQLEVLGEIDEGSEDDEELMVLTDDDVDEEDDKNLPVLGEEDDPVAALQAMSSADDSASDSEDDIDVSWLADDDNK